MAGSWSGHFGNRAVDERWSHPAEGTVIGQARLCDETGASTIELILIREIDSTLELVLRQFEADLSPRLAQHMHLDSLTETSVAFVAEASPDNRVAGLTYRHTEEDGLEIDVAIAGGPVITAQLVRD